MIPYPWRSPSASASRTFSAAGVRGRRSPGSFGPSIHRATIYFLQHSMLLQDACQESRAPTLTAVIPLSERRKADVLRRGHWRSSDDRRIPWLDLSIARLCFLGGSVLHGMCEESSYGQAYLLNDCLT